MKRERERIQDVERARERRRRKREEGSRDLSSPTVLWWWWSWFLFLFFSRNFCWEEMKKIQRKPGGQAKREEVQEKESEWGLLICSACTRHPSSSHPLFHRNVLEGNYGKSERTWSPSLIFYYYTLDFFLKCDCLVSYKEIHPLFIN